MALDVLPSVSIRERIRAEIEFDPTADDARLAGRVLYSVEKADLLPLVIAEVQSVRREGVRRHERVALPKLFVVGPKRTTTTADKQRELIAKYRREYNGLRTQSVDLGDGTTVLWGKATVDQLRQRLAMLEQHARGINATIEQMRTVIVVLEQTGVSCLDDLR